MASDVKTESKRVYIKVTPANKLEALLIEHYLCGMKKRQPENNVIKHTKIRK